MRRILVGLLLIAGVFGCWGASAVEVDVAWTAPVEGGIPVGYILQMRTNESEFVTVSEEIPGILYEGLDLSSGVHILRVAAWNYDVFGVKQFGPWSFESDPASVEDTPGACSAPVIVP